MMEGNSVLSDIYGLYLNLIWQQNKRVSVGLGAMRFFRHGHGRMILSLLTVVSGMSSAISRN